MRVLSFGHLPSWAGGRQESGLANVIYQLAKHESSIPGIEVYLAATDSFIPIRQDGNLSIVGWTKGGLLIYLLFHPFQCFSSFLVLKSLKRIYPIAESFWGLFLKRVFLSRTIHNMSPNIIHLHGPAAIWYLDLVPSSVKVALTFHGMTGLDENLSDYRILYEMEKALFHSPRVDGVFFICTKLVDSFVKAYGPNGKNNSVIFNSYDHTQFYLVKDKLSLPSNVNENAINGDKVSLYTVASLSDLKGQLRVLVGIKNAANHNKFEYTCIGGDTDGYANELLKYAEENNLSFRYLGKMPPGEIREELLHADYMIMPSSSEGFGLTYLEAIACGVPVILPKDLPIAQESELINDNNSIMLEDCSSKAITKVLNSLDKYKFNRVSVAETITAFSWDEIAFRYINAYKQL